MEAIGLNIADWFIIIVLTASGLISLARGFTKEFLSLFLWLIAFIAAVSLEYLATPKINEYIGNEEISKIVSYIVVFMICIVLGGFLIKFIVKVIKWSGASGFDKFLGVLFGLSRGLIVLFVIFLLLPSSVKTTDLISKSKITPLIEEYAPQIEAYFRNLIDNKDIVEDAKELIDPVIENLTPASEEVKNISEDS
ncbi:MAG: CvpA family protein [SAR86 cluster bacterium]|jgi:membrane protein required for colicin V production|nr:MAG: CvpA family protein [SAR86 cluster bacterium]URQ69202.1 CvpA family protein [SAR86 cluster bacterium]|tara:strand:- start:5987 stop:6571 length:585 start_codon:yes stop_codon:yes gene_type:complete